MKYLPHIGQWAHDIFLATFFLYAVSFLVEGMAHGFIVQYFDINRILAVCVVAGIISAICSPTTQQEPRKLFLWGWCLFFAASLAIIISVYTRDAGQWSSLLALFGATVLIVCIAVFSYKEPGV